MDIHSQSLPESLSDTLQI